MYLNCLLTATSLKSVSTCVRTLKLAWLLFSLVIIATYTGKLTSNYLIVQQPLPFNSLHELLQRTDYKWGYGSGTSIDDILSVSHSLLRIPPRDDEMP